MLTGEGMSRDAQWQITCCPQAYGEIGALALQAWHKLPDLERDKGTF